MKTPLKWVTSVLKPRPRQTVANWLLHRLTVDTHDIMDHDGNRYIRDDCYKEDDYYVRTITENGEPVVDQIVNLLKHDSVRLRRISAMALGILKAPRSVVPLLQATDLENDSVQDAVVNAVLNIGDSAVPSLVNALNHANVRVRWTAAKTLSMMPAVNDTRAYDALLNAISECDVVSECAARALVKLNDPRTFDDLMKCIDKDNSRLGAVKAFEMLTDPRSTEPLTKALSDNDGQVRSAAAQALSQLALYDRLEHHPHCIDKLITALNDDYPGVHSCATSALAYMMYSKDRRGPRFELSLEQRTAIRRKRIETAKTKAAELAQSGFSRCAYCGFAKIGTSCDVCKAQKYDPQQAIRQSAAEAGRLTQH